MWSLGALGLAVLTVGIDGRVLRVALPTLAKALHASKSDPQWFSSGYFLLLAAAMLLAGLLGARYGYRRSSSSPWHCRDRIGSVCALDVGGGVHGRPGADRVRRPGVIVMAFSVITVLFSKAERPKAVGVMAALIPPPFRCQTRKTHL